MKILAYHTTHDPSSARLGDFCQSSSFHRLHSLSNDLLLGLPHIDALTILSSIQSDSPQTLQINVTKTYVPSYQHSRWRSSQGTLEIDWTECSPAISTNRVETILLALHQHVYLKKSGHSRDGICTFGRRMGYDCIAISVLMGLECF